MIKRWLMHRTVVHLTWYFVLNVAFWVMVLGWIFGGE